MKTKSDEKFDMVGLVNDLLAGNPIKEEDAKKICRFSGREIIYSVNDDWTKADFNNIASDQLERELTDGEVAQVVKTLYESDVIHDAVTDQVMYVIRNLDNK